MPAEFYNFKPTPQEMTFGEQMLHIARANMFTFRQLSGVPSPFSLDHNLDPANREAVTKLLQKSFDYVLSVLPQLSDQKLQKKFRFPLSKAALN
jgi:DinB superfamily